MSDYSTEIAHLKELIESHMANFLPDADANSKALSDAMRYTLYAPGKRIRPVLLLLACKAVGGGAREALPYACAIEFIHNYSLIHDDLPAMDDDDLRRGRPTNHKVFGEAMAILAGDGLLSAAFELMHEDYLQYLNEPSALQRRVSAGAAIAAGCGCRGMVAGQAADIETTGKPCTPERLEFIHRNKTAALLRAAVCAGAWLGGADPEGIRAFEVYGENIGLAFQIADDLLDRTGDTITIGKTVGKDLAAGKAVWPALHGTEAAQERLSAHTELAVQAIEGSGANAAYVGYFIEMAQQLRRRVV